MDASTSHSVLPNFVKMAKGAARVVFSMDSALISVDIGCLRPAHRESIEHRPDAAA